jgi:transposase
LQQRLRTTGVPAAETFVVLEATSTYWIQLAGTLHAAGYAMSVVNPKQAHDFAKARRQQAKTDPLDAGLLAQLGQVLHPPCWAPSPLIYYELQQRLAQRDELLAMRTQLLNQRHALLHQEHIVPTVSARRQALVELLESQIATIEQELRQVLELDEALASSVARLQSIPGVGLITATWLAVATLNFTTCSTPQAAAAYAGLAPHPWQSRRRVRGRGQIGDRGNGRLRTALYMATLSAVRYNPPLKAFYERLRQAASPSRWHVVRSPASCCLSPGPWSRSANSSSRTIGQRQ